jgi:hypothetical protein
MTTKPLSLIATFGLALVLACQNQPEPARSAPQKASVVSATPAPATAPAPAAPAQSAAAPASAAGAPAPAAAGPLLATEDTNWPGIVAEVTEFRRKGNTLTARVRFRNGSSRQAGVDFIYGEVYIMDAAGGKKYQVLKDEQGHYIAALSQNWGDRWTEGIEAGTSQSVWMKFPAPPPEVKAVTLQIPKVPPFEDLAIQD